MLWSHKCVQVISSSLSKINRKKAEAVMSSENVLTNLAVITTYTCVNILLGILTKNSETSFEAFLNLILKTFQAAVWSLSTEYSYDLTLQVVLTRILSIKYVWTA